MSDQSNLQLCNLVAGGMSVAEAKKQLGLTTPKAPKAEKPNKPLAPNAGDGGDATNTPATPTGEGALPAGEQAGALPAHEPEQKPAWMP